jgi:hypothetical protein
MMLRWRVLPPELAEGPPRLSGTGSPFALSASEAGSKIRAKVLTSLISRKENEA